MQMIFPTYNKLRALQKCGPGWYSTRSSPLIRGVLKAGISAFSENYNNHIYFTSMLLSIRPSEAWRKITVWLLVSYAEAVTAMTACWNRKRDRRCNKCHVLQCRNFILYDTVRKTKHALENWLIIQIKWTKQAINEKWIKKLNRWTW